MNFSQKLDEIQKIVHTLEKDELPLEAALELFEQGVSLVKECQVYLTQAEQKIFLLTNSGKEEPLNMELKENNDE
ncbi:MULTISPECIES: exodeoxyribonuclease VII small subunit [Aminobacterium]|jgi:exodeoxyribonuclease VII small subunit|uniref:Exodeoxyribonuclease 7 small subunit n=1 Tax=Aminobacterium colombiense (strain DSM 12261 / ALA-1) TaxID=572547 RepID=D5EEK2_AMICL|nr:MULTISPECIES: exodeoxyribonuclease VII small subunit [Aminobacterium]MDD2378860.1 exodeoxyribonuclease VII small subunit [Aminobacterium colombiense]ADE56984.1 Exonuclease VII small subunit [Aminobacterium colombiense DSM 12261]MDD3768307.1 exodeoxyribonuclease VII small subunit [Aminobacterium colombiense]MDD4266026.1 exodeoxyribonuclease VII small subunit [Aminobacterium colombiense]MDD4585620.1 exodeoxyribonuclease VII small subunit [Aminobacterium colombiense]